MRRRRRTLSDYELGLWAAPFAIASNASSARVGLSGTPHILLDGLSCGGGCACDSCSSGFGVLAPGTTTTGAVASTVVGAAATAVTGAVAGAELGSVAGPIGTVVGAVAGYLTSKLFGRADYAAIYSQVENSITLAEAYIQVAGQYPGRVYGWLEMQYIWSGLVHYGAFPQNYNGGGALGTNPGMGVCTQASISRNINACGTQSWINSLITGDGTKAIQPQITRANRAGVFNPEQIWSGYVAPVWAGPVECDGCVDWFLPQNARSGLSNLVAQLVTDTIDAIEFNANDCLPNYYGSLPHDWVCGCSSGCGTAIAPVAAPAPAAAQPPAPTPALVAVANGCSPASVAGASIQAGDGNTLCDPAGNTWSFGTTECNTRTCQGFQILVNGYPTSGYASTLAYIDGQIVAQNTLGSAVWQAPPGVAVPYSAAAALGGTWPSLTSACVGAPAGYTQIATDTSGNPVYENEDGVLYECQGAQMVMFSGDLDLSTGVEPAQYLQMQIQGDLASGQSITQATQNALASVAAQGTATTPDVADAVAAQVAVTAGAPTALPAATIANPSGSSSSTTTDVVYGLGALAAVGLLWWALSGKHRKRR
jgi:hypothetical protein